MRTCSAFAFGLLVALAGWWALAGRGGSAAPSSLPQTSANPGPSSPGSAAAFWEVKGTTEPAPGRKAVLSPVPLHPVISVNVRPDACVKKDQLLVKLDDDEARADLRAKQAALAEMNASLAHLRAQPREEERAEMRAAVEAAKVGANEAQDLLKPMAPVYRSGALPEATYYSARASLRKLQADERAAEARQRQLLKKPVALEMAEMEAKVAAAQAAVEVARAELEHYTITAPIDGVVSWLDVYPGTVSRPGTTVWGEILDLKEIDVRCDLTSEQAERVAVGQTTEVRNSGGKGGRWSARGVVCSPFLGPLEMGVSP